jgi:hypothetical protein
MCRRVIGRIVPDVSKDCVVVDYLTLKLKALGGFGTLENTERHNVIFQQIGIMLTNSNMESCYFGMEGDKETVFRTYVPPFKGLL